MCSAISELNPTPARLPTCFSDPLEAVQLARCTLNEAFGLDRPLHECVRRTAREARYYASSRPAGGEGDTGVSLDGVGNVYLDVLIRIRDQQAEGWGTSHQCSNADL